LKQHHLHIICFDVPYPVDYGGVFDVFYKIKALQAAGVDIILHCFEYGRGQQPILEEYCKEVHYYDRVSAIKSMATGLPHIVASRANPALLQRLLQDDYPILMEGVHTTYFLKTGHLPQNRCFVRLMNVEHRYYAQLAETSKVGVKKIYYQRESKLLKNYEKSLAQLGTFWTLSHQDLEVFHKELGYKHIDFLPLYLPEYEPQWNGEMGSFCLYHANLGVPENEYAATWLLEDVFSAIDIPLVIAGKNPSASLEKLAHKHAHTCLVANPDSREMDELIKKAQVNILPSFNTTGIKLKLIHALYGGRHCLTNESGVEGSGLNHLCAIANSRQEMRHKVEMLYKHPFNYHVFAERSESLKQLFCNQRNARQMINWIFNGEPSVAGTVASKIDSGMFG
jgi:hypothetical protein